MPLFIDYRRTRKPLYALAHRLLALVPLGNRLLNHFGAVRGTRENCGKLMQEGAYILLYPGGAREVFKAPEHQYKLLWEGREGFARLALEEGCTIVPMAVVGHEDHLSHAIDWRQYLDPDQLKDAFKAEFIPPLPRWGKASPLGEHYIEFLRPILSEKIAEPSQKESRELKERVERNLQRLITRLVRKREEKRYG